MEELELAVVQVFAVACHAGTCQGFHFSFQQWYHGGLVCVPVPFHTRNQKYFFGYINDGFVIDYAAFNVAFNRWQQVGQAQYRDESFLSMN